MAIRLADFAMPGQVICTQESERLFRGRFRCASLGQKKLRGVAQPIQLLLVEGIAQIGSLIEAAAPTDLSPLIGRDHEMSLLKDRWEQVTDGMSQVVLLVGDPGIGKSRLVYTLKEYVRGELAEGEADASVIEWRCSPRFQNTELYPAIDFFERTLGFDREALPRARFDRLLLYLEQHDLARPETVPLWASVLSLPTSDLFPLSRCRRRGSGRRRSRRSLPGSRQSRRSDRFCSFSKTCTGWMRPRWNSSRNSSLKVSTTECSHC